MDHGPRRTLLIELASSDNPIIRVYAEEDDGQLALLQCFDVSDPFPDWELIARRVMRLMLVEVHQNL